MKLLCGVVIVLVGAVLSGCGDPVADSRQPEAAATPVLASTAAPQPTPAPVLALGLRKQGIVFHDLTQGEQVCPGFAEILAPFELSSEDFSDQPADAVRQVRIICTNDDTGTVYIVDMQNQTITVMRKSPPVPGMP